MKIPNMATTEDYRRPLTDLEHGNSPDMAAEAAGLVPREQGKREARVTVVESAIEIASAKDESLEKIVIETAFSQGGEHEI